MFLTPMQHGVMNAIKKEGKFTLTSDTTVKEYAELMELVQARVITQVKKTNDYKDARNETK